MPKVLTLASRCLLVVVCLASSLLLAQTITTVAGGGAGDGGPAAAADLGAAAVAVDASGNVYVADGRNHRIRKIAPNGVVTTVAGRGGWGFEGDGGAATQALLNGPAAVAVDAAGNVYFSDSNNARVRKVDTNGAITTVAGNGTPGFSGDGASATSASIIAGPIAVDTGGNLLIAQSFRVRRVVAGTINTVAGSGSSTFSGDGGPALSAGLAGVSGLASDGAGGFYVSGGGRVRRVSSEGTIATVAGNGGNCFGGCTLGDEGPALNATLYFEQGISHDDAGNLYIADSSNNRIRKVDTAGVIHTVAGVGGNNAFTGDGGPAIAATLGLPPGVAAGRGGVFYIADSYNYRVRKVDAAGVISTIAGIGQALWPNAFKGNGLLATDAAMHFLGRANTAPNGDLLIPDDGVVRRVGSNGLINVDPTVGGTTRDLAGNLYWMGGNQVKRMDTAGAVTVVAGNGNEGDPVEGWPAIYAAFKPTHIAVDSTGNLYIANNAVRIYRVDAAGRVHHLAGNGSNAYTGEPGPAHLAGIAVEEMAVDGAGNVYFIQQKRIRKIDATTADIGRFAGDGTSGYAGDGGPAIDAVFGRPTDLAADAAGNVYVVDGPNYRVRWIDTGGRITTLVGNGMQGFKGDAGPAPDANLHSANYVSWDPAGQLFISEAYWIPTPDGIFAGATVPRIRKVTLPDATPAPFTLGSVANAALGSVVQSGAITPAGFSSPARVSNGVGGEYSIGCNGTFSSAPGFINPGQSICVRHVTSSDYNRSVSTWLWIGGVQGVFSSRTAAGPGTVSSSALSLDFGGQSMHIEARRQFTVTNTGSTAITLGGIEIPPHFRVEQGCGQLAAGQSCVFTVILMPLAPGVLDASLVLQLTNGPLTVSLVATGERSLTTHYYRAILGREPDSMGKSFWEGEAARMGQLGANVNETWFALASAFFASPEYLAFGRGSAAFVRDLYRTFFAREPDAGGSDYWVNQLDGGMPREVLIATFMFSPEFARFTSDIFGSSGVRAEIDMVTDFYRGLLARLPDDAGFGYWVGRFRSAQCTRQVAVVRQAAEDISKQFADSSEYAARNRTSAQFVGDMYNAFMRRGGDLAGVLFWIDRLDKGARTRDEVRKDFVGSIEFFNRVARVVNQGCPS